MAKKRSTKRTSRTYLSTAGFPEMLARLDRVFGEVQTPLSKAYKAGMAKPEATIKDWFGRADRSLHPHRVTGRTVGSYLEGSLVWKKDGTAEYRYGFDKKDGGLTAIFFEYGTPRIRPQFVMYYAVKGAVPEIEAGIWAELERLARQEGLA